MQWITRDFTTSMEWFLQQGMSKVESLIRLGEIEAALVLTSTCINKILINLGLRHISESVCERDLWTSLKAFSLCSSSYCLLAFLKYDQSCLYDILKRNWDHLQKRPYNIKMNKV